MTGATHSSVKRYRDLARNPPTDGLDRDVLLDGPHLLLEAERSGVPVEQAAFARDTIDDPAMRLLADRLAAAGTDVSIVSRRTLESISPVRTPSGVVAIARRRFSTLDIIIGHASRSRRFLLVAHDVQDPGNVGGLVRTAEATGAAGVVVCGSSADPLGWKALRGSMGSALRVPLTRANADATLDGVIGAGISPVALVPRGGTPIASADLGGATALFLGGEGRGLPEDLASRIPRHISVPMEPPVESLNVGVAAAIVMYEAFRQRA